MSLNPYAVTDKHGAVLVIYLKTKLPYMGSEVQTKVVVQKQHKSKSEQGIQKPRK